LRPSASRKSAAAERFSDRGHCERQWLGVRLRSTFWRCGRAAAFGVFAAALGAGCGSVPVAGPGPSAPPEARPSLTAGARSEPCPGISNETVSNKAVSNEGAALDGWSRLRRLSVEQYENTLRDLFADHAVLHPMLTELERLLAQLPRDGQRGQGFPGMDERMAPRHVGTYVRVAEAVAREIGSQPERLAALAGDCALAARRDDACLQRFVRRFGRRVYRRALTDGEVQSLLAHGTLGEASSEAFGAVLARLLASPLFWLRAEPLPPADGAPASAGTSSELDDNYVLASRLSYQFWQTLPDEALLRAAERGELTRGAGYRAQVERLVHHQRARATWFRFFRQWLGLDGFAGFARDRSLERLSDGLDVSAALYSDAVWEIEELVAHYTFDEPGSYRDVLTTNLILTRSPRLAALYGVKAWDGHSRPASFSERERGGLLTRAALLISGSHATNPFDRGAFVRRQLLCEPIEPPSDRPPDAFMPPAFDAAASTRARYERKVSPIGCKGCHDLFTPYGYALEAYDALGRFRSDERLIDDLGAELGRLPVDSRAQVQIEPGQRVHVENAVELGRALAGSSVASECLARQWFRFTFQRRETRADACTITQLHGVLLEQGLPGLLRGVAFTRAFTGGKVDP
jgi:hypothetical protein